MKKYLVMALGLVLSLSFSILAQETRTEAETAKTNYGSEKSAEVNKGKQGELKKSENAEKREMKKEKIRERKEDKKEAKDEKKEMKKERKEMKAEKKEMKRENKQNSGK